MTACPQIFNTSMKDIFNKDFRKLVIGLVKPIKEEFVFFVFLIVLLSPRTFYFLFTKPDKWIDFTYFPTLRFISLIFFLAWLFAWVVLLAKSKMVKKGIYIILYFLFFINLFLALNFKAAISPMTMMLLFESNIGEAEDFVATYIFTIPTFITFISVFLLMIINIILEKKKKDILKHKIAHLLIKCKVCLFVLLLLIVGGIYNIKLYPQLFACNTVEEMDAWNPGGKSSMDNITNLLFSCYDLYLMGNVLGDAVNSTLKLKNENISCVLKDSLNIILVIGESFIKNHSSLYGYELQTNPLLKKEKDAGRLIVFSDVVSPTIYTSSSIRNMLSCNSIGDGEKWHEYPFWPAIFKKAGYRVYFWDNQYLPLSNASFDFSLNSYLYHDKIKKLSYDAIQGQLSKIDSDLIGNFKAYRESKNGLGCYTLVLFHLQGQHFDVKARYPHTASFQRFAANDIKKEASWINNAKKVEIANYDNCTLFNDYVVNSIISLFQN